jgi:hypothetical protein
MGRPSHTSEGFRECGKAHKVGSATHWLSTLANGFQGVEDLKTNLKTMLIVGVEAKTCGMIVCHVKADLENTPQPPTWRAKYQWIMCRKNTGTIERTQRYRTQGAIHVKSREQRSTTMEDSTHRRAHHTTESNTDLTQV